MAPDGGACGPVTDLVRCQVIAQGIEEISETHVSLELRTARDCKIIFEQFSRSVEWGASDE